MVTRIHSKINFNSNSNLQELHNDMPTISNESKPAFDKLIKDTVDIKNNQQNSSFLKKFITYPTFSIPICGVVGGILGITLSVIDKAKELKKQGKTIQLQKEELSKHIKQLSKILLPLIGLSALTIFIMDNINKKLKDKHDNNAIKVVDNFNKENDTNIKLTITPFDSVVAIALADPISGQIFLDKRASEDTFLANIHQKHFLEHELVHAKQFMLIACSEDGIEKLNYIEIKKLADNLDEKGKKEISDIYEEIKGGVNIKYKNANIDRFGYKINIVDYITALYKVMYEKDITPKDIPIIINKDFYQQIKTKKGRLSFEEEEKAQDYIKAYENYPKRVGFMEAINPNSNYRQNLLEKEAYKKNPWYTL